MTTIELFDFQKENVEKLDLQTGVLIADEMGLGKTYQAIARDLRIREKVGAGLTLVVAPLSVTGSWVDHYKAFAPELNVYVVSNKSKKHREYVYDALRAKKHQVYVIHWDALRLLPGLAKVKWQHIIADECHRAQNRKAQQTTALKKLPAEFKTGLSGTWITNTPDKAWSVLNWLYPKEFPSYWRFYGKHVDYEIIYPEGYHKITGPKNLDVLHEKIGPYYVRHLKKGKCCDHHPNGVMPELPDKYYAPPIRVPLTAPQKRAYEQMRRDMIAWVGQHEDEPVVAPIAIARLTRLQQFAAAYAQLDAEGNVRLSEPSSKLDAVMELIQDTDEPIVVFSQFRQLIELLYARLQAKKIPTSLLTGFVDKLQRDAAVRAFQAGRTRVFAGTIAAGGVGVTLTAASTVAFLDRSWSPALNLQAEDRLWRYGQDNAVEVIDFVAAGTVDMGRLQQINLKWSWLRQVLGDA